MNIPEMDFIQKGCENLMDLNDDCLLYLLRFFKLVELMELRGICRRCDILIFQSRTRFSELKYDADNRCYQMLKHTSQATFLDKVKFLGSALKSLEIYCFKFIDDATLILKQISEHCVNLEKFNFSISGLFRHMRTSQFGYLNIKSDSYLEILKKNLKLKQLTIEDQENFEDFHNVVHFISQNLVELEEISFSHVTDNIDLLGNLSHLKKLEIGTIDEIDKNVTEPLNQLLEKLGHWNIIEEFILLPLSVDVKINVDLVCKLTSLKKLALWGIDDLTDTEITKLESLKNLESLTIFHTNNSSATLNLIKSLPKLCYINLNYANLEFIKHLIQMLKQSQNRPKLEIFIDNDFEKTHEIENLLDENTHIITITY